MPTATSPISLNSTLDVSFPRGLPTKNKLTCLDEGGKHVKQRQQSLENVELEVEAAYQLMNQCSI
jgi:hypothetical protein